VDSGGGCAGGEPEFGVASHSVRDRAQLLGLLNGVLEILIVNAEYSARHAQAQGGDLELLVVEDTHDIDIDTLRRRVVLGRDVGERHRVARRVGGGQQLLGTSLTRLDLREKASSVGSKSGGE
jgi:hypothetical protein